MFSVSGTLDPYNWFHACSINFIVVYREYIEDMHASTIACYFGAASCMHAAIDLKSSYIIACTGAYSVCMCGESHYLPVQCVMKTLNM